MANKIVREIIHAKGIDIGIYTKDFENEYISLTDIAKYRNDNDPRFVIQNWMRNRNEAGLNRFAMAFATWISPEFQLYIMKDYRRLKQDENSRLSLDWNLNRALSKVNYRITQVQ